MISHDHRFVFVHIPRTGGTSIEQAFGVMEEAGKHTSARELRQELGAEVWSGYFKFTVVRNPWARAVSYYLWRQRRLKEAVGRTFDEWIALVLRGDFTPHTQEDRHPSIGLRDFHAAMSPQLDMLTDEDGVLLVNAVARFERLQAEFDTICATLGLDRRVLPHVNELSYAGKEYWRFYSHSSVQLVADRYGKDIATFGYEFPTAA